MQNFLQIEVDKEDTRVLFVCLCFCLSVYLLGLFCIRYPTLFTLLNDINDISDKLDLNKKEKKNFEKII